jgi:ATP-binding cassette subfamily B protein
VASILEKSANYLETFVSRQFDENGIELSGGEYQKIALARAFFKDTANFIILDEPSSALDPELENEIFLRLTNLYKDKGLVLISHRLSNIIIADMIFVLENGTFIENGTHAELMHKNGRYAYLFNLQAKRYQCKD